MNKIEIDNLDPNDLPFFARFLEGQMEDVPETESEAVIGGGKPSRINWQHLTYTTNKYPSDMEDNHGSQPMTNKYPSDREDMATTQKYPSDGDDNIGIHPRPIGHNFSADS